MADLQRIIQPQHRRIPVKQPTLTPSSEMGCGPGICTREEAQDEVDLTAADPKWRPTPLLFHGVLILNPSNSEGLGGSTGHYRPQ
jgi:hypothetical protein